jgi:hypothetical protein
VDAPECSFLIDGILHGYDWCPFVAKANPPFQLFYQLKPDEGGTLFHGGFRVQQDSGWAAWALASDTMEGALAIVAKTDASAKTGAMQQQRGIRAP